MITSKRGRLSSADREKIHALSERGLSISEIANEVERREDVVEAILATKRAAHSRKSKVVDVGKVASNAATSPNFKVGKVLGLLTYQLWVRPGFQIDLTLPGDLSEAEAERLSAMIRALPFAH